MRFPTAALAALALSACVFLPIPAPAQTAGITAAAPGDPLTASPVIGISRYSSVNHATYAKTATGLLVVLSPAELAGPGPLNGSNHGLTLEIPDFFIRQLFF